MFTLCSVLRSRRALPAGHLPLPALGPEVAQLEAAGGGAACCMGGSSEAGRGTAVRGESRNGGA